MLRYKVLYCFVFVFSFVYAQKKYILLSNHHFRKSSKPFGEMELYDYTSPPEKLAKLKNGNYEIYDSGGEYYAFEFKNNKISGYMRCLTNTEDYIVQIKNNRNISIKGIIGGKKVDYQLRVKDSCIIHKEYFKTGDLSSEGKLCVKNKSIKEYFVKYYKDGSKTIIDQFRDTIIHTKATINTDISKTKLYPFRYNNRWGLSNHKLECVDSAKFKMFYKLNDFNNIVFINDQDKAYVYGKQKKNLSNLGKCVGVAFSPKLNTDVIFFHKENKTYILDFLNNKLYSLSKKMYPYNYKYKERVYLNLYGSFYNKLMYKNKIVEGARVYVIKTKGEPIGFILKSKDKKVCRVYDLDLNLIKTLHIDNIYNRELSEKVKLSLGIKSNIIIDIFYSFEYKYYERDLRYAIKQASFPNKFVQSGTRLKFEGTFVRRFRVQGASFLKFNNKAVLIDEEIVHKNFVYPLELLK